MIQYSVPRFLHWSALCRNREITYTIYIPQSSFFSFMLSKLNNKRISTAKRISLLVVKITSYKVMVEVCLSCVRSKTDSARVETFKWRQIIIFRWKHCSKIKSYFQIHLKINYNNYRGRVILKLTTNWISLFRGGGKSPFRFACVKFALKGHKSNLDGFVHRNLLKYYLQ